jgi:hypothetical protein
MQTDEYMEEIKRRLVNAFQLFRCVVETLDYDRAMRFKVFDNNGQCIIPTKSIPLRLLIDDFENVVEEAKADIRLRRPDFQ